MGDYKKEQPVLKTPVRKRRRPMTPGRRPLTRSMQKTGKFNKEFQLKNSLANIEEKDEYQRRKLQEKEHELKYNELYEQKMQLDDKLRNMLEIQKKLNEEIKEKENNFKSEEKLQYQLEEADKKYMDYKKEQEQEMKNLMNETNQLKKQLKEIVKNNQEYKGIIAENQFKDASQMRSKIETKVKNLEEELNQTKEENKNLLIKNEQLETLTKEKLLSKKSKMVATDALLQQKNEENIQFSDRSALEGKIQELEIKLEQQLAVNDNSLKDMIKIKKKK